MKHYKIIQVPILLLSLWSAGCTNRDSASDGTLDVTNPTLSSVTPADGATNVAINAKMIAVFNEEMDPLTFTSSTFTVTGPGLAVVSGTIEINSVHRTAIFTPTANLAAETLFVATLTMAITDSAGNPLSADSVWSFTTGTTAAAGPELINLGTAGNFAILTKAGVTDVPTSAITGNVGTSPITGAAIGFDCPEVVGTIYTVDAAGPACHLTDATLLTTAVGDMEIAYTNAAGRTTPDFIDLGAGEIGGLVLVPGLYNWSSNVLIKSDVTISGAANDVWIFQMSGNLTQANGVHVNLLGGAQAKNIFWQVGGGVGVAIGTTAHFEGTLLAVKAINLNTGATVNGRLLSQTAVTLKQNTVVKPAL